MADPMNSETTHSVQASKDGGPWRVAKPVRGPLDVRWRCAHHWHAADEMIAWFCCRCGDERDGMPQDGRDPLRAFFIAPLWSWRNRKSRP